MLKLMYLTNDPVTAKIAEDAGVDRIFLDTERLGKFERQGHLNTVITVNTSIEDALVLKPVLQSAELMIRINQPNINTKDEVERCIACGADVIMLPYFKTAQQARELIGFVNGRAKVSLLVETDEAMKNLDEILDIPGIDEIHVGINDLSLSHNLTFLFEELANGNVEYICKKAADKNIRCGFGGVGRPGHCGPDALSPEMIIAEHYRIGSQMVILSRSFANANKLNDIHTITQMFDEGVKLVREAEKAAFEMSDAEKTQNQQNVRDKVEHIVEKMQCKVITA